MISIEGFGQAGERVTILAGFVPLHKLDDEIVQACKLLRVGEALARRNVISLIGELVHYANPTALP